MSADRIKALLDAEPDPNPPEGFEPIGDRGGYDMLVGPYFGKMEPEGMVLGFRCSPRHVNGRGVCHGGMIATTADQAVYAVRVSGGVVDRGLVTVSLTTEFLRPIEVGSWVEVRTRATKHGRQMHFAQMVGTVDGTPVFQANGVFFDAGVDGDGPGSLAAVLGHD